MIYYVISEKLPLDGLIIHLAFNDADHLKFTSVE